MRAVDVHNYFTSNGLVGDFWKDIVEIDNVLYIPTPSIVNAIGSDAFRRMQCNVTVLVRPEFDLYANLRGLGLSKDRANAILDMVERHYTKK